MAQWFYAEGPNRNVGPLSEQEMGEAYRRGLLMAESPVWREGMAQWQPLRQVAGELGLQFLLDGPPPMPGAPPPLPPSAQRAYPNRPAARTAARSEGMGRGAIIAIVCICVGVALVGMLGILAAIAVPAYADYTAKAKVSSAIMAGSALRPAIEAHLANTRSCPDNDTNGFKPSAAYSETYVESIVVGQFDDGTCGMEVRARGIGRPQIDGHAIWLSLDPATRQWTCNSDMDDRWLPVSCKG